MKIILLIATGVALALVAPRIESTSPLLQRNCYAEEEHCQDYCITLHGSEDFCLDKCKKRLNTCLGVLGDQDNQYDYDD
ncbi:unnamed protein product [Calicophoron daubneyi]|uniref:Uncharacterized protein n=1 Tax=Calicophoron daubneyi TaxID=300641 RepID=A0AAV2TNB4_CALDB